MVLGLRNKSKKAALVHLDCIVHIQEIKPWPPSQSLRSIRSVVLHWENGDCGSGYTNQVIPHGEGKIDFNESFKLHVGLTKDGTIKGNNSAVFRKHNLDMNIYEPRNKTLKGQLIGSAVIDLADHANLKETVSIQVPVNCRRSFKNTSQPVLFIKIEPFDKEMSNSSSSGSLFKETPSEKDSHESVSELMSEEYAEEAEVASFTDDDDSSHSSLANSSSTLETNASSLTKALDEQKSLRNVSDDVNEGTGINCSETDLSVKYIPKKLETNPITGECAFKILESSNTDCTPVTGSQISEEKVRPNGCEETPEKLLHYKCRSQENDIHPPEWKYSTDSILPKAEARYASMQVATMINNVATARSEVNTYQFGLAGEGVRSAEKVSATDSKIHQSQENNFEESQPAEKVVTVKTVDVECYSSEATTSVEDISPMPVSSKEKLVHNQQFRDSPDVPRRLMISDSIAFSQRLHAGRCNNTNIDRLNNVRSMRYPLSLVSGTPLLTEDVKDIDVVEGGCFDVKHLVNNLHDYDQQQASSEVKHGFIGQNGFSTEKIRELELKVCKLEAELRETAAIEISLYSIVAEHGSSTHKVHAPARRLARLYNHAFNHLSPDGRASAAKSAVSGLVLTAKACGNDVQRLTFWLSNSVVLRTILSKTLVGSDMLTSTDPHSDDIRKDSNIKLSPLKWESNKRERKFSVPEDDADWTDLTTFLEALEKIEAWLFSKIIESVWWQTFTPHMQVVNDSERSKKLHCARNNGRSQDQQDACFSIDLWKKAFKEAGETLCPLRAAGHECGCFPMLSKLVMEQCVARLDVAMFNAILRESTDEIPTDPISDPISDLHVLPIPAGKLSFGTGAQLKNAIGNWSRWLSDMFGIDDECHGEEKAEDDDRGGVMMSLESFHLLNALSDLLMLPKEMLLDSSIRKEVCPTFNGSIIKKILRNFIPDEFCPDPIPKVVLETLDAEDSVKDGEFVDFPCNASSIIYSPPSVHAVVCFVGDSQSESLMRRSGSSVNCKYHTSDDELDELNSPFDAIVSDKPFSPELKIKEKKRASHVLRYQLLHEVWRHEF